MCQERLFDKQQSDDIHKPLRLMGQICAVLTGVNRCLLIALQLLPCYSWPTLPWQYDSYSGEGGRVWWQ
jgi:hypothetical protein